MLTTRSIKENGEWAPKSRKVYDLDEMYRSGKGLDQNYEEAVKWWRKAADQGNTKALCKLGTAYYKGKGTEQNYKVGAR